MRGTAFLQRSLLFAFLWWLLGEGVLYSVYLAVVSIVAAAAASLALAPPTVARWRPAGVLRLAAYFVRESLAGGMDVARRAFSPSLPLQPALVQFELTHLAGFPAVLFVWLVSLMPGTASARLEGPRLTVHVLDVNMNAEEKLAELEKRIVDARG